MIVLERPSLSNWPYVELPDATLQPQSTKARAARYDAAEPFLELGYRRAGHDDVYVSRPPGLVLEDARHQKRPKRSTEQHSRDLRLLKIVYYF